METAQTSPMDAELARLEEGIRRLKVQYDMFFAGALAHEPVELRSQLQRTIKRFSHSPFRKYAQRFHFNALVSRFNSFCELWSKTTRSMEQGGRRTQTILDKFGVKERLVSRCRLADDEADDLELKRLHRRYVESRRLLGGEARGPSFESFAQKLEAQVARLRRKSGCGSIEVRLVQNDDQVRIKIRPAR